MSSPPSPSWSWRSRSHWRARRRERRFAWLVTGVVLGAACWLAPIVQQFTASYGNLTGLLHAGSGQATLGTSFALRDVGMAAAFHPIWLTHLPQSFFPLAALETVYPAWYGGVVLGALAVVGVAALASRRTSLGAVALLTFATGVGLVVDLAVFPTRNILSVGYLVDAFWVFGMALWVVALWVIAAAARALALRMTHDEAPRRRLPALPTLGAAVALVAVLVVWGLGLEPAAEHPAKVGWTTAEVRLVSDAATSIEDRVAPGPVSIVVLTTNFYLGTWATEGIAYRLESDGWVAGTSGDPATYTGLTVPRGKGASFLIRLQGTNFISLARTGQGAG